MTAGIIMTQSAGYVRDAARTDDHAQTTRDVVTEREFRHLLVTAFVYLDGSFKCHGNYARCGLYLEQFSAFSLEMKIIAYQK